tara:strand:+ start:240 stop:476 length:237 start_codon:yes stop_codon:yes gene_type:complete
MRLSVNNIMQAPLATMQIFDMLKNGATLREMMNVTGRSDTRVRAIISELRGRGIVISVQSNAKSYGDYLNATYKRVEA